MSVAVDLKQLARNHAKAKREEAHENRTHMAVSQAVQLLLGFLRSRKGEIIAGYMPIHSEIDPRPAMRELCESSTVCVPVVEQKSQPLRFDQWTANAPMVAGAFGAMIPETSEPVIPQVVIVPMLAFNRAGHRLGYGGGFYDRTLEKLHKNGSVFAVGLAYSGQEMIDFPVSPTDVTMDAIVTENEILTF